MQVTGLDFAAEMLADAERRQGASPRARSARRAQVHWLQGDALELPFDDASFGAATMGYGLRNVADVPLALRELARVLRPGGCAAVLDFNHSRDLAVDAFQARALLPDLARSCADVMMTSCGEMSILTGACYLSRWLMLTRA
jgi:demethylmenaquinone methyltransferase/2-methoxy-6-polyprenyl-1,4-benzoquinol methylase